MTEFDRQRPSWRTLPMVREDQAAALLDRENDLGQVVLCLVIIYRALGRIVQAARRLHDEDEPEAGELRAMIAHQVEYGTRWLERLEARLPRVAHEFVGAASRSSVQYFGAAGASWVVVATKVARAVFVNLERIAQGQAPLSTPDAAALSTRCLGRARLLSHTGAMASWVNEQLGALLLHDLVRDVDIEWANARRAREGTQLLQPQVRRILDDSGVLKDTPARLLIAVRALNAERHGDPGHKLVAARAGLRPDTSRQYLCKLVQAQLLTEDPILGWVLTGTGFDRLASYEARTPDH